MNIRDRVAQTTNTSGLGDLSLDGTADGFLTFQSQLPPGKPFIAEVRDGDAFEIFETQLNAGSPYTLTRGALVRSSTGSKIDLSNTPNKVVFLTVPAELYGPMGGRARFAMTSGTAPDYEAVFPTPIRALKDGTRCTIVIHAANPSADNTFTPDGLATKPLQFGRPLRKIAPGKLTEDLMAELVFSESDDAWNVVSTLSLDVTRTVAGGAYTVGEDDHDLTLIFTNAGGCAVTVPQATGQFAAPFRFSYIAAGGAVVFTPTTSTIDGAATLTAAAPNTGSILVDGGNYRSAQRPRQFAMKGVTKAATYIAAAAESGSVFKYLTSGFIFRQPTFAVGGADTVFLVMNKAASGDINVNPDGTATLDGFASRLLRPGRAVMTFGDGVNSVWDSLGGWFYESGDQTLTLSASLSLSHGLGQAPDFVTYRLKCISAEGNYAVDDVIEFSYSANSAGPGFTPKIDKTNIVLNVSSNLYVVNNTTHSVVAVTASKWVWNIIAGVFK